MEGITDAPNGDSIEVALLGGRWDDVRPVLAALSGRGFSFSDPAEEIAGEGEPGLLLLSPGYQYRPRGRALRAPGQPPRSPTLQCIARSPESDELYPEADDVILVPCSESEMAMRIRRLTVEGGAVIAPTSKALEMAGITLNPLTFQVLIDGLPVTLTWMEFHLLKFFMQHSGRVFRREEILQRVWGSRYEGSQRTVDVHIRRLRHKLGVHAGRLLSTVRNVGYGLQPA